MSNFSVPSRSDVSDPLVRAIALDKDPFEVAQALKERDHFAFLDTSSAKGKQGRFSILAWDPCLVFRSKNDAVEIRRDGWWSESRGNPLDALDRLFRSFSADRCFVDPWPFAGGAIGYFGYDLFPFIEHYNRLSAVDDLDLPDCYLGFYDAVLIFDHRAGQWALCGTPVFEGRNLDAVFDEMQKQVQHASGKKAPTQPPVETKPRNGDLESNFTHERYVASVRRAIDHIFAGDIYQVNLSQRFTTRLPGAPFDLFSILRRINPSRFGAFLPYAGHSVISSSPELFLARNGPLVETWPIKGTRPRGKTPDEDARLLAELVSSPKDRAELSMIVDLERNDFGRVCEYGSVKVAEHAVVDKLPTVFHTYSAVTGRLRPGVGTVDLLRATFPGGSITGCPKIRSIQIIDELEPTRRNVYTGSVGMIDFCGNMTLNIAIRTLITKGDRVYFQVGGGIVADSDPEAEYEETLDKAAAMIRALSTLGGGHE